MRGETIIIKATEEYINRKTRKEHPDGKFDNGKRWYPSEEEKQTCCDSIRSPSRSYPFSLMTHCRSISHIAKKFGVDEKDIRKNVKELRTLKQLKGES